MSSELACATQDPGSKNRKKKIEGEGGNVAERDEIRA